MGNIGEAENVACWRMVAVRFWRVMTSIVALPHANRLWQGAGRETPAPYRAMHDLIAGRQILQKKDRHPYQQDNQKDNGACRGGGEA